MVRLFKYLPSKYLDAFIGNGEVLFRSLSYFRNYEEMQVRGDRHEGKRVFTPTAGLEITKVGTGERFHIQGAFESTVQDRDIFVFCMSKMLSPELAEEFKADVCVELTEPAYLIARVRAALQLRGWGRKSRLLHGPVNYYSPEVQPLAEWAVPERIVMHKTCDYSDQAEYRLAFAHRNVLQLENVATHIRTTPDHSPLTLGEYPEQMLKLGSLKKYCKVHWFG